MSTEQNIQPRLLEPGYNIIQGRGGQALVLDTNGNIFLTSPNKPNEQQSELSVNKSLSSIAIMSNTGSIINTSKKYPSNNFNLIDQEQTLEDNKVIIQSTPSTSSSDLDVAVDISPTSSVTSSVQNQIFEKPKSNKEIELEFLPEIEETEFSRITDSDIEGVKLIIEPSINTLFIPLIERESYNLDNFNKLGGEQSFKRTITTPQELIKQGKEKKIDKQLLKSIISVIRIEQNYKGFNNNLSGVEALGWLGIEKYINGYVYATEGGTGRRKPFVSFKSLGDQLEFLVIKFNNKNLKISNSQSSTDWAKLWYDKWNGYGARSKKGEVAKFKTIADYDAYVIKETAKIYSKIDKLVNQLY
jgi:hypothetical protein